MNCGQNSSVEGKVQIRENATWKMVDREVQPFTWVNDPKAFDKGGEYYDAKIAVSATGSYYIENGLYKPLSPQHKHRVLYQGRIITVEEEEVFEAKEIAWSDCEYALGFYEIACAELCGLGHYTMRGFLIVEPRISFDWWYGQAAMEAFDAGEPFYIWKNWKD